MAMCRTSDEAVELFAEGNGRARVRKSSEGEMALWASIGPALNASVNASVKIPVRRAITNLRVSVYINIYMHMMLDVYKSGVLQVVMITSINPCLR